jgi:hypothetical protein
MENTKIICGSGFQRLSAPPSAVSTIFPFYRRRDGDRGAAATYVPARFGPFLAKVGVIGKFSVNEASKRANQPSFVRSRNVPADFFVKALLNGNSRSP